jgi:putative salt-induced outer membrane protein
MRLLVQAGPGYRLSKLSVLGTAQDEFVVRGSADFEYQFSDSSSLTSTSIVTWDSSRTTLENTIALTSDLFGGLSSRLSFNVRYNSDPPALTRKTDTLSKVSLVYGF